MLGSTYDRGGGLLRSKMTGSQVSPSEGSILSTEGRNRGVSAEDVVITGILPGQDLDVSSTQFDISRSRTIEPKRSVPVIRRFGLCLHCQVMDPLRKMEHPIIPTSY